MSNFRFSSPARSAGQKGGAAQTDAQRAANIYDNPTLVKNMRNAQTGSEMSDIANKAEHLADQQQDYEQRLRHNFGEGQDNQAVAQQMADEKKQMHAAYDQLQKEMQAASRDMSASQPDVSKKLRDAMGKSQQDEIGNKMDFTEQALRAGMPSYAVMREAPVTRDLNELKDEMKRLEASAAGSQGKGDDNGKVAMQQALDQAERVRREVEQLSRAQSARNGNQQGNQQGGQQAPKPGQGQQGQSQQGQGQQGQGKPGGQQSAQNSQQGGQQPGGQQGQGQQGQGQQGQGQQGGQQSASGNSPRGQPRQSG